jgi:hypothetical protein
LRTHDANFFRVDFDALSERAEVVTAVAAALDAHAPAGQAGKRLERTRKRTRQDRRDPTSTWTANFAAPCFRTLKAELY